MTRELGRLVLAAALMGAMTSRARAGLVVGSMVDGSLTGNRTGQLFATTSSTVGGAGFGGTLGDSTALPVIAEVGADTLTISIANSYGIAEGYAGFDFVFDFTNLMSADGGTITGLAAEAGGSLPVMSTSFTGSSLEVDLDGSFSVSANTTLTTTFDIVTTPEVTATPEPGTIALVVSSLPVGLAMWWRRRERVA